MSMISEQIENLRRIAKEWNPDTPINPVSVTLNQAADTIESLSAKLQAANMEQSAEDCGGWMYCGDGNNLPKEPFGCIVTVIDTEPMTQKDFEGILPYHVGYDGKQWNDIEGNQIPFEVIAWRPAPREPYHET